MKKYCALFFALLCYHLNVAQSTYIPLNKDYYHLLDRYEILSGNFATTFHTGSKPYLRQKAGAWLDSTFKVSNEPVSRNFTSKDKFNLQYLANDNWAWSGQAAADNKNAIFNTFYRKKADLFDVDTKDFVLHVNPVLYLEAGTEQVSGAEDTPFLFTNTRGLQVHGTIDDKIGFYSYLSDNQAVFPTYVRNRTDAGGVVPGEGFWKRFKENGVDFFTARGHIAFPITRHIGTQMGYGRHFFGNGHRSMVLSDFANDYLFLKIDTKVWRIQYTNLFTEMRADVFVAPGNVGLYGINRFPKKYFVLHRLGIDITNNLKFGLYETITFGQDPALTGTTGFELSYLIPIIFYRSIEQESGSPDNASLGADIKWNFLNHFSLYGQLMLDEFILSEARSREGWWGNKYAGQVGIKYINAFTIANLDLQLEHNFARPYAYAHESVYTNYTHYRQPLAHPLGANFREILLIARFQPLPRLSLNGKFSMARYGSDTLNSNWGQNIFLDYATHQQEFGNKTGQGIPTDLLYADLTASYQLFHNFFTDLNFGYRHLESEIESRNQKTVLVSFSIRWNIARRENMF